MKSVYPDTVDWISQYLTATTYLRKWKEKSGPVVPGGRTLYGRKISAERFDAVFNLILGLSMVLRKYLAASYYSCSVIRNWRDSSY